MWKVFFIKIMRYTYGRLVRTVRECLSATSSEGCAHGIGSAFERRLTVSRGLLPAAARHYFLRNFCGPRRILTQP
jgi:hypothetical protein